MARPQPRGEPGGIAGLIRWDREHGGALDLDCIERLGVRIAALPRTHGWGALAILHRNLPQDSATWRARHPEEAAWSSPLATAAHIAAVFDAVTNLAYLYASAHSKPKPPPPQPYPRPWAEERGGPRFGRGAIPVSEFRDWYYSDE